MPATFTVSRTPASRFYSADYHRQLRDMGILASLSLAEHVTLNALANRAGETGVAWPAVARIAREYGIGKTTVRECIKSLAARGLLLVVRTTGRVNTYRLTLPATGQTPPGAEGVHTGSRGGPPREPVPIMSSDHPNQHEQQHDDAHEAAALLATPTIPETPTAPEAAPVENEAIAMLPPEIVERVRELGIAPAKVNRYGAERVRWVLDRLQADRARKVIGNPAGWVMQVLKDTWGQPLPGVQMGLPFAQAATKAARPPAGTRWGRHREGGHVLEVLDVNEARAQLAGGSVIPSHRWGEWEWLTANPGEPVAIAVVDQGQEHDTAKQTAMAMLAAWVAAGTRTPDQLAAKLEARGLTSGDWEAYQAVGGRV